MDTFGSPRATLAQEYLNPEALKYTNKYVRRLLMERHNIRARLENPGGSVVLTASALVDAERGEEYSCSIGSAFHLDLIEAETQVNELIGSRTITKRQAAALLSWFDGLDTLQASKFLQIEPSTIRSMRSQALHKVTKGMNERQVQKPRKIRATSDLSYQSVAEKAWNNLLRESLDRQQKEIQEG